MMDWDIALPLAPAPAAPVPPAPEAATGAVEEAALEPRRLCMEGGPGSNWAGAKVGADASDACLSKLSEAVALALTAAVPVVAAVGVALTDGGTGRN